MQPHPIDDPMMLAPPPRLDEDTLAEVLARDWGLRGRLAPLGGERDRNFRLEREDAPPLLVKLAHPDEDPAITDFQTAALLHLEAADPGLPVPRVLRDREGGTTRPHPTLEGRSALLRVLTYLPGRPTTDPLRAAPALGALAARLDRAFSGFRHPAEQRRLLWDLREAPGLRPLLVEITDPALRRVTEAALDRFERLDPLHGLPAQAIHNDLNPHNVVVDEAGQPCGIIDFGDVVRAPLLQEVATTSAYLLLPGADPLAAVRTFVAAYRAVQPLPEELVAQLPVLIATRMVLTVLITHWRARLQPENAAYILRNAPGARAGLETLMTQQG